MRMLPVLLLLLLGESTQAYPTGAPLDACTSLTPNHRHSPQAISSPYILSLSGFDLSSNRNHYYEPGETYPLTLSGTRTSFRGFLLQARLMADDSTLTGSFSAPVSGTKLIACSPISAGLTHSSNSVKSSVTGTWTAPPAGTGAIRFRFAVVQAMSIYWANITSNVVYESGPPTNFVLESRTEESLSFSWGLPPAPIPTGYRLECHTTVAGVTNPPPVETADQSARLSSLSPGVLYICTLNALTGSHRSPSTTISATTLESAPTGPPLSFTAEQVGDGEIMFSWEPPEPHLKNGIIVNYTITCVPSPLSPLSVVYQAGSITFSGFSLSTSYSCSVKAANSAGTGPPAFVSIAVEDEVTLIQVTLFGVGNCLSWKNENEDDKLADMTFAIVDNVNERCTCSFTNSSVLYTTFHCFDSNSDSVTFSGGLQGLLEVNSSVLAKYVVDWVKSEDNVTLQGVEYKFDHSDLNDIVIRDQCGPECGSTAEPESPSSFLNAGEVVGVVIAVIVVLSAVVGLLVIIIVWSHWMKNQQRGQNLSTSSTTPAPNLPTSSTTPAPNVSTSLTTSAPNLSTSSTTPAPNLPTSSTTPAPNLPTSSTTAAPNLSTSSTTPLPERGTMDELQNRYHLTSEHLAKECSREHRLEIGKFINWNVVGPCLGRITPTDIDDIQRDKHNQQDGRDRLLELWAELNGYEATYSVIISAMLKARKRNEAEKVFKLLSQVAIQ